MLLAPSLLPRVQVCLPAFFLKQTPPSHRAFLTAIPDAEPDALSVLACLTCLSSPALPLPFGHTVLALQQRGVTGVGESAGVHVPCE